MQVFLSHVNNSSVISANPLSLLLRILMEDNSFGIIWGGVGGVGEVKRKGRLSFIYMLLK